MTHTSSAALVKLQAAYGAPTQTEFGSAVFGEALPVDADLAEVALAKYQYFIGDL